MSEASLYFHLRDDGTVLANRRRGRAAAARLRANAGDGQDIILDFADVEAITPPFVQELLDAVHAILGGGPDSGRLIVIVNASEDVLETLGLVLERRKSTLAFRDGERVELLSAHGPHLLEVLEKAQKLRRFTAAELAQTMSLEVNTLHGRLKPLLESGVIGRQRDPEASRGVRHIYRVVTGDEPAVEPETPAREAVKA
jgi:DNA-binding MarR family transcriptional regulator